MAKFVGAFILFSLSCLTFGCGPGDFQTDLGGYVLLEDGTPVEGVVITFEWPEEGLSTVTVTTDEEGWYSYQYVLLPPSYARVTVTPSHKDYDFEPSEYDLNVIDGDALDLDFVAIPKD